MAILQITPTAQRILDRDDDPTVMPDATVTDGIRDMMPALIGQLTAQDVQALIAWTNATYQLGIAVGLVQGLRVHAAGSTG